MVKKYRKNDIINYTTYQVTPCHEGNVLVFETNKVQVFGGGTSRGCSPYAADLVINLTGRPHKYDLITANERAKELIQIPKFEIAEITIDWPDMGIVPFPRKFWKQLATEIKKASQNSQHFRVLVHCLGGHGRTGTALACLAWAFGVLPKKIDPVEWIREIYCEKAVETQDQIDYIVAITGQPSEAKPAKSYYYYNTK